MATPIEGLSALLVASSGLPTGTSIYAGPQSRGIVAPAVVIRPDEPWIEPGNNFCHDLQHYVAIPLVQAAAAEDGTGKLYAMAAAIIEAIDEAGDTGWSWVSVGMPAVDTTTDTAFLAAPVRLQFRNGDPA